MLNFFSVLCFIVIFPHGLTLTKKENVDLGNKIFIFKGLFFRFVAFFNAAVYKVTLTVEILIKICVNNILFFM